MPAQYVAMRDKLAQKMPMQEAKAKAAAAYNKQHPGAPVTRGYDKKHPPKKKGGKLRDKLAGY